MLLTPNKPPYNATMTTHLGLVICSNPKPYSPLMGVVTGLLEVFKEYPISLHQGFVGDPSSGLPWKPNLEGCTHVIFVGTPAQIEGVAKTSDNTVSDVLFVGYVLSPTPFLDRVPLGMDKLVASSPSISQLYKEMTLEEAGDKHRFMLSNSMGFVPPICNFSFNPEKIKDRNTMKDTFHIKEGVPVLVCPAQGAQRGLRALRELGKKQEVRMHLFGTTEECVNVPKLVEGMGINPDFVTVSSMEEVTPEEFYNNVIVGSMYVSFGRNSVWPMDVLMAMHMGVPIAASDDHVWGDYVTKSRGTPLSAEDFYIFNGVPYREVDALLAATSIEAALNTMADTQLKAADASKVIKALNRESVLALWKKELGL